MRIRNAAIIFACMGLASAHVLASGQAGIYGIVERVVFEPDARSPGRVQIWGAFALIERSQTAYPGYTEVQGQVFSNYVYSKPAGGYLYFRLPEARHRLPTPDASGRTSHQLRAPGRRSRSAIGTVTGEIR